MKWILITFFINVFLSLLFQSCDPKKVNQKDTIYVEDQLIVIFKPKTTLEQRREKTDSILKLYPNSFKKSCNNCGDYIELLVGEDIHTLVHGEAIQAGTRSTGTVGEDDWAYYSLNLISEIPTDPLPDRADLGKSPNKLLPRIDPLKDTVIIAVLDTGIDSTLIPGDKFLWKSSMNDNCYPGDKYGWNFVTNDLSREDIGNSNIFDDTNLHGTLINQFILNQFVDYAKNNIQLMNLKTHDAKGRGKLFDIICAIHYAKDNGANIINASWGFYYEDKTHLYVDSLITEVLSLPVYNILFLTAAGNNNERGDEHRRLDLNPFYPALLSDSNNNVITVTTIDKAAEEVSPTQNFSRNFVDFGVTADKETTDPEYFQFETPFKDEERLGHISGSSYATSIATGVIGARLPKAKYSLASNKSELMTELYNLEIPRTIYSFAGNRELSDQIRAGRFLKKIVIE